MVGRSITFIINIEYGRKPPPNFDLCKKIGNSLNLTNQELSEFLLAAMEERFGEEDKGFFELVGLIKVQEIISDKFGILFDDKRVLDLLYDPSVIEVLEELHSLEPEKKSQAMNMLKVYLKGLK